MVARDRNGPRHAPVRSRSAPEPARRDIECAEEAGLRYVTDERPGITRRAAGKGWHYFGNDGKRITDGAALARIRRLAIPPAWTEVWICPLANGHLQATGRDQRRRKQYRYHAEWRATRDADKFGRMMAFGRALPRIRRCVAADVRQSGLGREKVLAAMVRLLETTHIRVGNDEYARANRSYGLSTLRNHHVTVGRGALHFAFTGKSGKRHEIELNDPHLAKLVAEIQDLPGQELFAYESDDGNVVDVKSDDVNAYLREIGGEDFSAKDFRTWAGTVVAAELLARVASQPQHRATKKNLAAAIREVAERLGNTPSVCRKCYVHPAVIEGYLAGRVIALAVRKPLSRMGLSPVEKAVLALLERAAKRSVSGLEEALVRSVRSTRPRRSPRNVRRPAARTRAVPRWSGRAA
jgi:DNA topoisomerase I